MVEAATNKINTLLESFLGINDSELGKRQSDPATSGAVDLRALGVRMLPDVQYWRHLCFSPDSGYRWRISVFRLCLALQYRTALLVRFDSETGWWYSLPRPKYRK